MVIWGVTSLRMCDNRKVMNKGEMKEERVEMFKVLLGKIEENKRVNQWF